MTAKAPSGSGIPVVLSFDWCERLSSSTNLNCGEHGYAGRWDQTATPVIDLSTNIWYVTAETLENNGSSYVKRLHAPRHKLRRGQTPWTPVVMYLLR